MAAQRTIKMRISYDRALALYNLYRYWTPRFNPEGKHELLLQEHMIELQHRLKLMIVKEQEKYTLNLCGTEAMAFLQAWELIGLQDVYQANVIRDMIAVIDQGHHAKKLKPYHEQDID